MPPAAGIDLHTPLIPDHPVLLRKRLQQASFVMRFIRGNSWRRQAENPVAQRVRTAAGIRVHAPAALQRHPLRSGRPGWSAHAATSGVYSSCMLPSAEWTRKLHLREALLLLPVHGCREALRGHAHLAHERKARQLQKAIDLLRGTPEAVGQAVWLRSQPAPGTAPMRNFPTACGYGVATSSPVQPLHRAEQVLLAGAVLSQRLLPDVARLGLIARTPQHFAVVRGDFSVAAVLPGTRPGRAMPPWSGRSWNSTHPRLSWMAGLSGDTLNAATRSMQPAPAARRAAAAACDPPA